MSEEEQVPEPVYIPPTYKAGVNLLLVTLPLRNVIEGLLFFTVPAYVAFVATKGIPMDGSTRITIILGVGGIPGYFGFHGINGGSFSQFLLEVLQFLQRRRTVYYNPRVKYEAIQSVKEEKVIGSLDINKKYFSSSRKLWRQQREEPENTEAETFFFKEDIGHVETPWEYKSAKERRKIRKAEKKAKREERKTRST